jgi:hypothetical protein
MALNSLCRADTKDRRIRGWISKGNNDNKAEDNGGG